MLQSPCTKPTTMNESDTAPVAAAHPRAGEKGTEGITVDVTDENQIDVESLFDAIGHEVEVLIERTEGFDSACLDAAPAAVGMG